MKHLLLFITIGLFIHCSAIAQGFEVSWDFNKKKVTTKTYNTPEQVVSQQTLHLYGGGAGDVYLGCLNCRSHEMNSIWNKEGNYGSEASKLSIWNKDGIYGNPYNALSPWNATSTNPPIIKDQNGLNYGTFTIDKFTINKNKTQKLYLTPKKIPNNTKASKKSF